MPAGAVAGIGAVGSIAGGIMGSNASSDAAAAQVKAAKLAAKTQKEMYEQTRGDLSPYRDVGSQGLYSLADLYGLKTPNNPDGSSAFNENALNAFKMSPDYQVAMKEGIGAVDASAAARGNLLSGGQIKRLADYGADLGARGFQGYMNRLNQLAGMGEDAASRTGQFGSTAATNIGNAQMAAGEAQAGGIVGGYNSLAGGMSDAFNNLSFAAKRYGGLNGIGGTGGMGLSASGEGRY
jgi:hypothetical protein